MALFDDSAKTEIERLRAVIAKLEESKGVRMVTVEMVRKPGYGYVFYITAPTMAHEREFGMAMAATIERSFRRVGADMKFDIARMADEAPSERERAVEQAITVTVRPSIAECYMTENAMGRWVIVNVQDRALAWSGSQWVPHRHGLPADNVQISNFATQEAAALAAMDSGLVFFLQGYRADDSSITCFRCGMTSYNANDVQKRYCGHCHVFHERA